MTKSTDLDPASLASEGSHPAVAVHVSRAEMGRAAASDISAHLRRLLVEKPELHVMFAAAPSQSEMVDALIAEPGIAWERIQAYHMDEYIDLSPTAPERFSAWLDRSLFGRLPFRTVHRIDPAAFATPQACADNYAGRLQATSMDVICLGIGVNGHLAFNDPPVADFDDPAAVKIVELDAICRKQQVGDGCFATLGQVPTHAITVTIPELMRGDVLFCVVPGAAKADAVRRALHDPVTTACPATILRRHTACRLYLDAASAGLIG